MAITVTKEPSQHSFFGNPVLLGLSTNNRISQSGLIHIHSFSFLGFPTDSETMTFEWSDQKKVVITFKLGAIDSSGNQVQIVGANPTEFCELLSQALNRNQALTEDFYFFSANNVVYMHSLKVGSAYQVNFSTTSGVITSQVGQAGQDQIIRENFSLRVFVDIWKRPGFNLTSPDEAKRQTLELLQPGIDNQATFDLAYVLDAGISEDPFPMTFNPTLPEDVSRALLVYRYRYCEFFGDPPSSQILTTSSLKYALPGGLSLRKAPVDSLQNWVDNDKRILINSTERQVHLYGQEWLHYYHTHNLDRFDVVVRIYLEDGSTVTEALFEQDLVYRYSLWRIPVGCQVLANIQSIDDAIRWEVWISEHQFPDNRLSQVIAYKIEEGAVPNRQDFVFLNSFGVYELFTARGKITYSIDLNRQTADKAFYRGYDRMDRLTETYRSTYRPIMEVATGYRNKKQMNLLTEFLSSRRIYLVREDHYEPVQIKIDKFDQYTTDPGSLNAAKFTVLSEREEEFYTHD